jgi:hypothetical protein
MVSRLFSIVVLGSLQIAFGALARAQGQAPTPSLRVAGVVTSVPGTPPPAFAGVAVGDPVVAHVSASSIAALVPLGVWHYNVDFARSWVKVGATQVAFDPSSATPGMVIGAGLQASGDFLFAYADLAGSSHTFDIVIDDSDGDLWSSGVLDNLATTGATFNNGTHEVRLGDGSNTVIVVGLDSITFDTSGLYAGCSGSPNSTGLEATLATSSFLLAPPSPSSSTLHLECTQGPPDQFGFIIVSRAANSTNMIFSGVLCLSLPQGRYGPQAALNQGLPELNSLGQFDASGVLQNIAGTSASGSGFDVPLALPDPAGLGADISGETWFFQAWYRDVDVVPTANFSTAIEALMP